MWRHSRLERALERARLGQPAGDVVLAEDAPEHPAARGHGLDRLVVERVLQIAEAVRHVGGDHRDLLVGIARVELREHIPDRLRAHVGDVDQDPFVDHRVDDLVPDLGQSEVLGLGEHEVVDAVREERQSRGVGRDVAKEQVRDRDVRDSQGGQCVHVIADLARLPPELEAALDRVDQDRDPAAEQRVEFAHRVRNRDLTADGRRRSPRPSGAGRRCS